MMVRLDDEARRTTGRKILQRAGEPEAREIMAQLGQPSLPPLLALLVRHRLRGIKGMARLALIGWGVGQFPGMLAMGRVSDAELLAVQAQGRRPVGVGLPGGDFGEVDGGYPGGFTHHDLCHLAKFRGPLGDDATYAGQLGSFVAFARVCAAEPELLERRPELPPAMDLAVIASDTNGDVRLLATLFFARLVARAPAAAPEQVVARYLTAMGLATSDAAATAQLYRSERAAFLTRVGAHFEAKGQALKSELETVRPAHLRATRGR